MDARETREQEAATTAEDVCRIACDALITVDDWLGMASTRQAAVDALWRLRRALQRAGFDVWVRDDLKWRGSIIRACDQAGIGLDTDGVCMRVRMPWDKPWQHASGPAITPDRLYAYTRQHCTQEQLKRLESGDGAHA